MSFIWKWPRTLLDFIYSDHDICGALGGGHVRLHSHHLWLRILCGRDRLCLCLRTALRVQSMIFDYALGGLVALIILSYLVFALLRPEKL